MKIFTTNVIVRRKNKKGLFHTYSFLNEKKAKRARKNVP